MKVEIITIGDEILIGQIVDTNSAWMARKLNGIGAGIERIVTIRDGMDEILFALSEAENRGNIVLITGGLGPTKDDMTKKALAQYFDCGFTFHKDIEEHIANRFARSGKKMTRLNSLQAELPSACEPLPNNLGTAPGMWFERKGTIFVSMPGVPYEMKELMLQEVIPRLKKRFELPAILHRTILTMGMGESWLSERIADWEDALPPQIKLAYLPSPGRVRLRLSASGEDSTQLEALLQKEIDELLLLIPELVYGFENETLEAIVGDLLREKGKTVATAESCTGGLIAHKLTSISGSSDYFMGSVISYANQVKIESLGVSASVLNEVGAVSEQVVLQMAEGVKRQMKTDYAIAVSGIAGPNGGTEEKPVGTVWIAIASPSGTKATKFLFSQDRQRNIEISANTALNLLRKSLITFD